MDALQPRVQMPAHARRGEVVTIRTLIAHPMETGLRHDSAGRLIPRHLVNRFECRFDGDLVFAVDLHEAMAADPFLEFTMRAERSGGLQFTWREDGGAVHALESTLTVT
jgi:sulfur-oxidizing protein SoxZ